METEPQNQETETSNGGKLTGGSGSNSPGDEISDEEASETQKLTPQISSHSAAFELFDEIIVGNILSLLSPFERRQKRLVCHFWKNLIDYKIGLEVTINCLNRQLLEFISKRIISTVHIRRLSSTNSNSENYNHQSHQGQVHGHGQGQEGQGQDENTTLSNSASRTKYKSALIPSNWLKHPKLVKTLTADQSAFIDAKYFEQILDSCCASLKHLKFSMQHLKQKQLDPNSQDQEYNWHWETQLSSLETLQLTQHLTSSESVNPVVRQTCQFLETVQAPRLRRFSLHFNSNHIHLEMDPLVSLQMALLKLIQETVKVSAKLTHLYLELKAKAVAWTLPPHLLQSFLNRHDFSLQNLTQMSKSCNQLEHLVLRFPHTCGFRFWPLFASHQVHLTKLVIQFADIKLASLFPLVAQNTSTLETLSLFADVERHLGETTVENAVVEIVNFDILQECCHLKNLHLEIPYREDRTVDPQFIQFSNGFPQSVERLDIAWLVLRTVDVRQISKLPLLKHLALIGCGEHDEFGVTIPILSDLLFNRNLQELFLFNVNHHFKQVHMRRVVGILHRFERHGVRVHVRERAFYIHSKGQGQGQAGHSGTGKWQKGKPSWSWGSATVTNHWTRPPAVFVNHYAISDQLCVHL